MQRNVDEEIFQKMFAESFVEISTEKQANINGGMINPRFKYATICYGIVDIPRKKTVLYK